MEGGRQVKTSERGMRGERGEMKQVRNRRREEGGRDGGLELRKKRRGLNTYHRYTPEQSFPCHGCISQSAESASSAGHLSQTLDSPSVVPEQSVQVLWTGQLVLKEMAVDELVGRQMYGD